MRRYCKDIGDKGEEFAAFILEQNGYSILERNFRSAFGEIDIIATKGGVLHFIEVKTRTGDEYGWPAEAVTENKARVIRKVSECYTARRRVSWKRLSFDVFEVMTDLIEDCM